MLCVPPRADVILPIGNLHINPLAQLKRVSCQYHSNALVWSLVGVLLSNSPGVLTQFWWWVASVIYFPSRACAQVHMARFRIRDPQSSSDAGDDENDLSSDEEEEPPSSRRASSSGSKVPAIDPASFPRAFDLDSTCASGLIVLLYASPASAPVVHLVDRAGALHPIGTCFADFFRAALMHVGVPHWPCAYGDAGGLPDDAAQWLRFLSPQRLAIDQAHARTPGHTNAAATRTRHHAPQHAAPSTSSKGAAVASSAVALDLTKIEELAQR